MEVLLTLLKASPVCTRDAQKAFPFGTWNFSGLSYDHIGDWLELRGALHNGSS